MKKILSSFLAFAFVFTFVFNFSNKNFYAVDYEVHVAVFCDNVDVAKEYVKKLCEFQFHRDRKEFYEDRPGVSETQTIIYEGYGDAIKWHTHFHIIDAKCVLYPSRELDKFIKICTSALILYDISDPKLRPMIDSMTHYEEDLKSLIKIQTPLNNCVRYLESWGRNGWYNSLEFVTYGKENLDSDTYVRFHERMNDYTGCLEKELYKIDNKWGRGNSDWTTLKGIVNPLCSMGGQARRSIIQERFLTGEMNSFPKKKLDFSDSSVPSKTKVEESKKDQPPCKKKKKTSQEEWEEMVKWFIESDQEIKELLIQAKIQGILTRSNWMEVMKMVLQNVQTHSQTMIAKDQNLKSGEDLCVVC